MMMRRSPPPIPKYIADLLSIVTTLWVPYPKNRHPQSSLRRDWQQYRRQGTCAPFIGLGAGHRHVPQRRSHHALPHRLCLRATHHWGRARLATGAVAFRLRGRGIDPRTSYRRGRRGTLSSHHGPAHRRVILAPLGGSVGEGPGSGGAFRSGGGIRARSERRRTARRPPVPCRRVHPPSSHRQPGSELPW